MHKNSFLANSVRFALVGGAAAAALSVPATFAADENEKVERISVTGSRIKQVDMETSSPVTVITFEDMQLSGEASVADVLNNSAANSFGSWRGKSGYGNGAAATSSVNLRGLGSNYTLVLLDGRRMPGTSSSSGASADTSKIPMAIVERIEILRDGASAVYGSDAVAGVINIITKKNYEGFTLTADTEKPSVEGGDAKRFTMSGGISSDKGNITFAYEYSESDAVFDKEIWKLNDPRYGSYSSYSSVPNGQATDKSWVSNGALCKETPNTVGELDSQGRCKYSYGAVTKLFGDTKQNSILSNFNYELDDNLQLKGRLSASVANTDTRYAGTPASTNKPVMAADNPLNPTTQDLTVWMRGAQLGERDTRTDITNIDALLGLAGYIDSGNGIDWEVNYQHSQSNTSSFNSNLLNDDILQTEINKGTYDLFNKNGASYADWNTSITELYGKAAHTGLYKSEFVSDQIDGFLTALLYDDNGISISGVVGAEFEQIKFSQNSDPQSASGKVSGGSGGDDVDAERDRTSAYVQLEIGLPADIQIDLAARYDKYDQSGDVGAQSVSGTFDKVAPQVGISWRPIDELLVRASWGKSFRAPNMGEMFKTQSLSFPKELDSLWCTANPGVDPNYCSVDQQHKTWFGGNPDLKPEQGESLSAGFVWNATDDLAIELSYYHVQIEDKIDSISLTRILKDEKDNGTSAAVVRDSVTGKIDTMYSFDQNLAKLETSGIDFKVGYRFETDYGDFGINAEMTHVMMYEETTEVGAEIIDEAGLQDKPDFRGNLGLKWSKDDFTAAWTTYYIGAQDSGNEEYDVTYLADIPSYVKHNVQVSYNHQWNGKVTLGVNNVFDKEATPWYKDDVSYRDINTSLYDVLGRTVFLKVEQSF